MPEASQKEIIQSLREEAMIELLEKQRSIIEETFENLHEEKHFEEEEPME